MDSFVIRVDSCEVARVSAERIECGKRCVDKFSGTMEDDPRMLRIMRDGDSKPVAVFYVSARDNVTVEKVSE